MLDVSRETHPWRPGAGLAHGTLGVWSGCRDRKTGIFRRRKVTRLQARTLPGASVPRPSSTPKSKTPEVSAPSPKLRGTTKAHLPKETVASALQRSPEAATDFHRSGSLPKTRPGRRETRFGLDPSGRPLSRKTTDPAFPPQADAPALHRIAPLRRGLRPEERPSHRRENSPFQTE